MILVKMLRHFINHDLRQSWASALYLLRYTTSCHHTLESTRCGALTSIMFTLSTYTTYSCSDDGNPIVPCCCCLLILIIQYISSLKIPRVKANITDWSQDDDHWVHPFWRAPYSTQTHSSWVGIIVIHNFHNITLATACRLLRFLLLWWSLLLLLWLIVLA